MLLVSLCTDRKTTELELASAFSTTGGSASGGSRRTASDTLLRTSLAAASRSTLMSNSTVIMLTCSREVEEMIRTPAMPLRACSSGSVSCDSITSGLAPA